MLQPITLMIDTLMAASINEKKKSRSFLHLPHFMPIFLPDMFGKHGIMNKISIEVLWVLGGL